MALVCPDHCFIFIKTKPFLIVGGHFVLEEKHAEAAAIIKKFLGKPVNK